MSWLAPDRFGTVYYGNGIFLSLVLAEEYIQVKWVQGSEEIPIKDLSLITVCVETKTAFRTAVSSMTGFGTFA